MSSLFVSVAMCRAFDPSSKPSPASPRTFFGGCPVAKKKAAKKKVAKKATKKVAKKAAKKAKK